jgi:thiamine biosynthesis lipoprotein
MQTVAMARHAMATLFEIVLHGENPVALRAAAEEALDEVERLESLLSLYRPKSEIAHLNARAAHGPVKVTPALFALLQHAKRLHEESGGAFDITISPLVRCWGFMGGNGKMPTAEKVAEARAKVGMHLVQLNVQDCTVQFAREGVMLDLGAIGKGHAVERAAEILREAGVTSAIVHGGTSTVYALGQPPEAESWKIAVEKPGSSAGLKPSLLATVPLKDEAMSVSAVWGRSFDAGGKTFGHVLDPRTGWPIAGALLAAVVLPSATETDTLSTALLTLGSAGHEQIASLRPGMRTLLILESEPGAQLRVEAKGITIQSAA